MPINFLKCSIIAFILQSFQPAILNARMNGDFREEQGFDGWCSEDWTSEWCSVLTLAPQSWGLPLH